MYQGVGMLSFNSYSLINIRFLINKGGVIMSHQNKKSLIGQADDRLQKMTQAGVGRSKHQDKIDDIDHKYIYTWETYRTYIKHCCYFLDWCKENHGCKTLKQCRQYVPEWIASRRVLSASTQKLDVAALSKLYRCHHGRGQKPFRDVETDTRSRADIKRSRGDAVRDKHFSQRNNADLITFCRCTGLRRAELQDLRYDDFRLAAPDGSAGPGLYVHRSTKGGRVRRINFVGSKTEIALCCDIMSKGNGLVKVWGKVHSGADIHSYRADYATKVYQIYARPIESLAHDEIYYCRGDRKGTWLDKKAMLAASKALGHNRISIIASNYLRL